MSGIEKTKLWCRAEQILGEKIDEDTWDYAREQLGNACVDENDDVDAEFEDYAEDYAGIARNAMEYFAKHARNLALTVSGENWPQEDLESVDVGAQIRDDAARGLLNELEKARAGALGAYYAEIAAQEHAALFRETYLEGGWLPVDQAVKFIDSPACRLLSRRQFEELDIPYTGHRAEIREEKVLDNNLNIARLAGIENTVVPRQVAVSLWVDPPGRTVQVEVTKYSRLGRFGDSFGFESLEFREQGGKNRRVVTAVSSVLYELRTLARNLSETYGLNYADIPLFVLSGQQPRYRPIEFSDAYGDVARGTITMRVDPWVAPETVCRAYRRAQRTALGRRCRAISERIIKLFAFVVERGEPHGRDGRWLKLFVEWNNNCLDELNKDFPKEWDYSSPRHFQRDYRQRAKLPLVERRYFESAYAERMRGRHFGRRLR